MDPTKGRSKGDIQMKMKALAVFNVVAGVVIGVSLQVVASDSEGNLLKNPGFEQGFVEWRKAGSEWHVEEGAGYDGGKALVWECAQPVKRSYPAQYVPLKPGCIYRFSALVKIDRLKGGALELGVEWFDVNGKWVAGSYARRVDDNGALKDGWMRFECETRPMRSTDVRGAVLCLVKEGSTGKVRFDDMTLDCVPAKRIAFLCTSAYRDSASEGDLRVFASVNAETNRFAATLTVKTAEGVEQTLEPVSCAEDAVTFSIPVARLARGAQKMVFRFRSREGGEVTDSAEIAFERTAPGASHRRVSFDSQRRMLLDGKRFFPLGLYTGAMSDADMVEYKRGPYNFAIQYGNISVSQLDKWGKAGVYVATDVRSLIYNYSAKSGIKTAEDSKAAFRKCYEAIGAHPALVMWYLNDEAPVNLVPNTTMAHEFLHSIDPERATITCLCVPNTPRDFLPSYDVMAHDCYPIGNHVGKSMLERVTRQMRVVEESMASMRPLWFIPQVFDWRWYYSADSQKLCDKPYLRMPTREEMANMTWQGIACGANGIISYAYHSIRKNTKGAEYEKAWGETCSVAFEVKSMEEVLLSDDITSRFAGNCASLPRYLPVRFYSHAGKIWMLAVNATRESLCAEIPLPQPCSDFKSKLGSGVLCKADGRILSLDLPPLGYAFVSFNL